MKRYKVAVVELRRKVVNVLAADEDEAHERAYDAWYNTEFMLRDEDFDGVEFYVLGETDEAAGDTVEGKGGVI